MNRTAGVTNGVLIRVMLLVGMVLAVIGEAQAVRFYQDQLFARYPNATTSLAGCIACHIGGGGGPMTPYGRDFKAGGYDLTASLAAKDSDGDGFTNNAELISNPATNPGDASSKPNKRDQTITFGAAPNLTVGGKAAVSASASSGLPVAYSSRTASICTIAGSTVTGVAAGTCTIAANQAGNAEWDPAPEATLSFAVRKANQTIDFGPPPVLFVGDTATVSVSATSRLPVTLASRTTTICTLSGTTVRGVAAGTCTIAANQAGDSDWNAAPEATLSFQVRKLAQTIDFGPAPALVVGGTATVAVTATSGLPVTLASRTATICAISGKTVRGLAVGNCTLAANQEGDDEYRAASEVTLSFPVIESGANYQGLWWKAPAGSEAGWGINFAHQGNIIFATWFTYDASGQPLWLVATLNKTGQGVYTGTLFKTSGPAYNAQPWTGPTSETPVGAMTVTFTGPDNGELAWNVNGAVGTKLITRQVFGPVPTCTWGIQSDLTKATNYQDLWWNAPANSESGWGINLTHQGDIIFATWFTYAADGKPWWLIADLRKAAAGVYTGNVASVTGPAYDKEPWVGSVVETTVGTATLSFANGNSAAFSTTVNGFAQVKQIARQVFVAPGTVCQ